MKLDPHKLAKAQGFCGMASWEPRPCFLRGVSTGHRPSWRNVVCGLWVGRTHELCTPAASTEALEETPLSLYRGAERGKMGVQGRYTVEKRDIRVTCPERS